MDIDFQAILHVFSAEADEHLAAMEQALLALEARPDDGEPLYDVFRAVHTLKGDAANLGFAAAAGLAHVAEDLLDRLRDGQLAVSPDAVALLLATVDALRREIPAALSGAKALHPESLALMERVAAVASSAPANAGDGAPGAAEGRAEGSADGAGDGVGGALSAEGEAPVAEARAPAPRGRTLRVDVDKLDRALDLVGEIAIARGRLGQMALDGRPAAELLDAHREADRLHAELQEAVMKMRMVPLGPVVRPFARTVRDVAALQGKLARLVVHGAEVEMDTSVVERLREPLTHMVRNAVGHGIEPPDVRRAAGKDPRGTVTVSAFHDGGSVVVRMSDDGAGLSRERIAARARAAGLATDPERMGDGELFALVLEPGFSTAEQVTGLSGRGVGLDVVRRAADALRGTVSLASRPGEGTSITLRLPLTLALIEGFSVGVAGQTYVIPLDAVVECLELPRDRHARAGHGVLALRGEAVPFVRLREHLGLTADAAGRESVVVVRHAGGRAGVVVDALLGDAQAVIKPLGRLFRDLPGVSGSTILGSGRVALILDVPSLIREALQRHTRAAAA